MKNRIIGILLVAILLMTLPVFATNFSDINGNENQEAIEIVSALKILNGNKDGTFKPYDILTRGQLAVIIANIILPDQKISKPIKELKFSDVSEEHYAYNQIAFITDLGFMVGTSATTFQPDKELTYEQAIKVMVALLGYDVHANAVAAYPTGYITYANKLGILKGIGSDFTKQISRGDMAKIIYNSLDVPLMQQVSLGSGDNFEFTSSKDKTILTGYLKTHKIDGQIIANDYSSLESTPSNKGFAIIKDNKNKTTITAKVGESKVDDALGLGVIALIKDKDATEHGDYEFIYCSINNQKVKSFKLVADQIEAFNPINYKLSYKKNIEDEKLADINLSMGIELIVNGCYKNFEGEKDLLISNGEINFIDNNNDGTYDLAIIETYYNIVVKSLSKSDGTILDLYNTGRKVQLDLEDEDKIITFITIDGSEATMFDINPFTVVSVYESTNQYGENKIKAVVNDNKLNGIVSSIDTDNNVLVGDQVYKMSDEFADLNKVNNYIISGLNTVLLLDAESRICGVGSDNPLDNKTDYTLSMNYGYLIKAGCVDEYSQPDFRILTPDSTIQMFKGSEKMLFNGVKTSGKEVIESLKTTTVDKKTAVSQLIKFKTNKDGDIVALNSSIMGTDSAEPRDADKLYHDKTFTNKKAYKVIGDGEYALSNASIGFFVPPNIEHEDLMKVVPAVTFSYDKINSIVYDSSYRKVAKAVVVDGTVSPSYENDDPTYVVTKVGERLSEDETVKPYVELFKKDGSIHSFEFLETAKLCEYDNFDTYQAGVVWNEDGVPYNGVYTFIKPQQLNSGDVVRIAIDVTSGKLSGVQRLFSIKGFKDQFMIEKEPDLTRRPFSYTYPFRWEANEGGTSLHTNYEYLLKWNTGYAVDVDSEFVKIKLKDKASVKPQPYKEQFFGMRPTNVFSSYIVLDEKPDGTFRASIGSYDDIRISEMVGEGKESLLFFKSRYAICHEIYIINFINDVRVTQ